MTESGNHIADEQENEILDRLHGRYVSQLESNHEFSHLKQLDAYQVRGSWISIHLNLDQSPSLAPKYQDCLLLLHSEQNRLRSMCDLIARYYVNELDELVALLLEWHKAQSARQDNTALDWQLESFQLAPQSDGFRLGGIWGDVPALYVAREVLLLSLQKVAAVLAHPDQAELRRNFTYDPLAVIRQLDIIKALKTGLKE